MPPTPTSPILSAKARPPDMRISISARNRLFCVGWLPRALPVLLGFQAGQQGDQIRHEVLRPDWERDGIWVPIPSRWVPGDGDLHQSVWRQANAISGAPVSTHWHRWRGKRHEKGESRALISFAHGHQMGMGRALARASRRGDRGRIGTINDDGAVSGPSAWAWNLCPTSTRCFPEATSTLVTICWKNGRVRGAHGKESRRGQASTS